MTRITRISTLLMTLALAAAPAAPAATILGRGTPDGGGTDIVITGPGTFTGGGGKLINGTVTVADGVTVTHYRFGNADIRLGNNSKLVHCTIAGGANPVTSINSTGAAVLHCAFTHISGTGVTFTSCTDSHVDYNLFDQVFEPVHNLYFSHGTNNSVSFNVITHATRHAIELQSSPAGLIVEGNWIDQWNLHIDPRHGNNSHIGISCATANDKGADSKNVIVRNNWVGGTGNRPQDWATLAIEIGLGTNTQVYGNSGSNWNNGICAGATGPCAGPWYCHDNKFGGLFGKLLTMETSTAIMPADNLNNRAIASVQPPSVPGDPTTRPATRPTTSPTTQPTTQPTTAPATQPAPAIGKFTLQPVAQGDGIHIPLPGTAGTLTWRASHGNKARLIHIAAGTTLYIDQSVPDQWEVDYTFTGVKGSAHVQAAASQDFAPPSGETSDRSREDRGTNGNGAGQKDTNGSDAAVGTDAGARERSQ